MAAKGRGGTRQRAVALGRTVPIRLRPLGGPVLTALAVLVALGAGYALARATPAFAVQQVTVEGAPPSLARDVRRALEPLRGRSLVGLDPDAVELRLAALAEVHSAGYDRAFPNTLVVSVRPERRAAVVRSGSRAWLVSARGRVLRPVERRAASRLPRVWLPTAATVAPGRRLTDPRALTAVRASVAASDEGFPYRVQAVRVKAGEVTFAIAGRRELLLGPPTDLALKLAVARALMPRLAAATDGGSAYLDVSTPERPVAGSTLNQEVEVEGAPTQTP